MKVDAFCIDASLLGTDRHLVCSDAGYSWRVTVPSDTWHLTGQIKLESDRCLDTLLRLGRTKLDLLPPSRFTNAMATFQSGSNAPTSVPWQKVMPAKAHRSFTKGLVDVVAEAIDKLPTGYYKNTWALGNGVLRSLQPAKIDAAMFQALVDAKVGNVTAVKSFAPDYNGFTSPVTYDRFGALTGRLTVVKGPSILTLKREYRSLLIPSTDGCIMSLDFAALEVRLMLYEAGKACQDPDLYEMIGKDMGYARKAVKAAVISELYGSSKYMLGKTLGIEGVELEYFVKRIKTYFNTPELLKRIKAQFYETGHVINRYGRPVLIDDPLDHIFINYYAQSSGVDVSLMGFSKIVSSLAEKAPGIRPLYVLHDALILDVPAKHVDEVASIKSVTVPGYVQAFPLKAERLSCTP